MLSDRATINVRGGAGGSGCVSFRREKFVPRGGPDGGDGGRGGDVALVASSQVRDLSFFHKKVHLRGGNGGHGQGAQRHGRAGSSTEVLVPVGTEVRTREGDLVADLVAEGQRATLASGGEGGRGNVCFVSSTRRSPRFAERGLPGDERWLVLRLKLLADIGLVGLPNAGKSSLLAALTRAHPKIAAYPFTTVEPNLGVLDLGERSAVIADIPGLVEGASAGVGLGHRFLAHIERTTLLLYVLDACAGPDRCVAALSTVRRELEEFRPELLRRPALAAVTKVDLVGDDDAVVARDAVGAAAAGSLSDVIVVSAVTGEGLEEIVAALRRGLAAAAVPPPGAAPTGPSTPVLAPRDAHARDFTVERDGDAWRLRGAELERLVAKTDIDNDEAVAYLQEVMERAGVSEAVRRAGGRDGDTVVIGETGFDLA